VGLLLLEGRETPVPVHVCLSLQPQHEGYHSKWYGDCSLADPRDAGEVAAKTGFRACLLLADGRRAKVLISQASHDQISFLGEEPLPIEAECCEGLECDVLVVETDYSIIRSLEASLREAGYTMCLCRDGAHCLLSLIERHPRLLILDLVLPDLRGWEVLGALRSNPTLKDTPVIALTALDRKWADASFRGRGPDVYLRKTDELHKVAECVRQFIAPTDKAGWVAA